MAWRKRPATTQGRRHAAAPNTRLRMMVVVGLLGLSASGLMARAFDLQVVRKAFYQRQGDALVDGGA